MSMALDGLNILLSLSFPLAFISNCPSPNSQDTSDLLLVFFTVSNSRAEQIRLQHHRDAAWGLLDRAKYLSNTCT
jgi:hypothetical protein